jgi:hypothetical protein
LSPNPRSKRKTVPATLKVEKLKRANTIPTCKLSAGFAAPGSYVRLMDSRQPAAESWCPEGINVAKISGIFPIWSLAMLSPAAFHQQWSGKITRKK